MKFSTKITAALSAACIFAACTLTACSSQVADDQVQDATQSEQADAGRYAEYFYVAASQ